MQNVTINNDYPLSLFFDSTILDPKYPNLILSEKRKMRKFETESVNYKLANKLFNKFYIVFTKVYSNFYMHH